MEEKIEQYYRQKQLQFLLFSDSIETDMCEENKDGDLLQLPFVTIFFEEGKRLLKERKIDDFMKKNMLTLQRYLYQQIKQICPQSDTSFVKEPRLLKLSSLWQSIHNMVTSDASMTNYYRQEMLTRLHLEHMKPRRTCSLEKTTIFPTTWKEQMVKFLSSSRDRLDVETFIPQIRHSIHLDYVFLAFLLEDREVPQEEDLYMYFLDSINVFLKECPELFMNPEVKAKIMHWILLEAADKEFTLENGCKKGLETLLDEQEQKRIQDLQYQIKRGKDSFTRIS